MEDKIKSAIVLSQTTGLDGIFCLQNEDELRSPFDLLLPQEKSKEPEVENKNPSLFDSVPVGAKPLPDTNRMQIRAVNEEEKPIFEKMFGYNPDRDMPYGYQRMTPFERATYRATLAIQNLATRIALGATYEAKGAIKLVLPESMEKFLSDDTRLNPDRLEEDRYYEKRIQSQLRSKESDGTISQEELENLRYLNETLPSGMQRIPEFIGRSAETIVSYAVAESVVKMIPAPGGMNLSDFLSEKGKVLIGDRLIKYASTLKDKPLAEAALTQLAKVAERLGSDAISLFAFGSVSADDENRVAAGAKMMPWSLVTLLSVPAKVAMSTKTGQLLSQAVAKVSATMNSKLTAMKYKSAKKAFVNQAINEADDIAYKSTGDYLSPVERKEMVNILNSVADDAVNAAQKTSDDIVAMVNEMSGRNLGKGTVSQESVIPEALRTVETAGDVVINAESRFLEAKVGLIVMREANGNYTILNKDTMQEVAVNIKRKNIAKEMDNLIFGVSEKTPGNPDVMKRSITKRTITEEVELKRSLRRMSTAANDGYRAGIKDANEKAAIKLQAAFERINTIKADNKVEWQNVEFTRQLIKDFVPKEQQADFMKRMIGAKTQDKVLSVIDDIEKLLNKNKLNLSIDSLRQSLKTLTSQYSDKAGKFSTAPDDIKPILESLSSISSSIDKYTQTITGEVDDLAGLANDMISGINNSISGRGQILGLPENMINDLYEISMYKPGGATAEDIGTLAELAKIVLHRTKEAGKIKINDVVAKASDIVDDSVKRIIPKKKVSDRTGILGKIKNIYSEDTDHPHTLITKMFGNDSKAMTLLNDIYEGQNTAYGVMRNSYSILSDYMRENKLDSTSFKNLTKKMDISIGGTNYKITRGDALGLAMSCRDPFVFDKITKTRGLNLGGHDVGKLTTDEISDIISRLSDDELKLGASFFHLSNSYVSNIINQTSIELNGIKIATYPQYYPSHNILDAKIYGNRYAMKTAETQSYFMPRLGGTSKMRINNFEKELSNYIHATSMYHGTAVPMRSVKTVFGSQSLQDTLTGTGHKRELNNLLEIIGRSEGSYTEQSSLDAMGQDLLNKFSKSVLGGRFSTIGTQICSVPVAKAYIPSKYFSEFDILKDAGIADDLIKNSDFFWHRWKGRNFTAETGDIAANYNIRHFVFNETPLSEKPLAGLTWGDKKAISQIHKASRRMIADTTSLVGKEAEIAAIKQTEMVTRMSQPNWDSMTRSKFATDQSILKRMFNMFRTAQESQANVIKSEHAIYSRSPKSSADKKRLVNSYKAVAEAGVRVALWKILWKHGRKTAISGVAGWLGYFIPNDNKESVGVEITKGLTRVASDYVPFGKQVENALEIGITRALGEKGFINTSNDPISTIGEMALKTIGATGDWINIGFNAAMGKEQRDEYTFDFGSTQMEDILEEAFNSKSKTESEKIAFWDKFAKDIMLIAKDTGLAVSAPIAPIDEWVEPLLNRSPYPQVRSMNHDNTTNPVPTQRLLHKFLTQYGELQKKAEEKGLNEEEAVIAMEMKATKSNIDYMFRMLDMMGENSEGFLDPVTEQLKYFYDEN